MMLAARVRALTAAALMFAASALAVATRPTVKVADARPRVELPALFAPAFGDWQLDPSMPLILPSPDTQALLDKIYHQTLSRSYRNSAGERVMLSVAYGGDQSEPLSIHKPEVCYPAQGFELLDIHDTRLQLAGRTVPVRRLMTRRGSRVEPVTYWIVVGDKVPGGGLGQRLEQLRYGMTGRIPDGMLVRVSTIDRNEAAAYVVQRRFLEGLVARIPAEHASRVLGPLAPDHP